MIGCEIAQLQTKTPVSGKDIILVIKNNQAGKKPGSLGAGLPANLALRGRILRSRGKILGSRGTILGSLGIFLNSRRHTKSKTITTELVALTYLGIDIS